MVDKYLNMYPHMKDEEIPEGVVDFCEYIIQQNASMADKYFKKHPEVAREFLTYFTKGEGNEFYRGGYFNPERTFLSASDSKKVARNFAMHGDNHSQGNNGTGQLLTLKAERYHRTCCDVDGEEEVFLWVSTIVDKRNIKEKMLKGEERTDLFSLIK